MKRVVKIGGIQRLPFTKICPEKAANGAFWGYSASFCANGLQGMPMGQPPAVPGKFLRT
jgi:hypothetical protein